jgi:hypothetical protein
MLLNHISNNFLKVLLRVNAHRLIGCPTIVTAIEFTAVNLVAKCFQLFSDVLVFVGLVSGIF